MWTNSLRLHPKAKCSLYHQLWYNWSQGHSTHSAKSMSTRPHQKNSILERLIQQSPESEGNKFIYLFHYFPGQYFCHTGGCSRPSRWHCRDSLRCQVYPSSFCRILLKYLSNLLLLPASLSDSSVICKPGNNKFTTIKDPCWGPTGWRCPV